MFSTTFMSMDSLGHPYIPVYTVLYPLPKIMIIGPTPNTTVVSSVLATPTVRSSPQNRPSGKL